MTGYTVHTGASKKFVNGWDRIFGDADTASKSKAAKQKTKKKSTSAAGKSTGGKAKRKAGKQK